MSPQEPDLTLHNHRQRVRYRAWHRGMLEMDMILGPFADANVTKYDVKELQRLETLMDEEDADLLKWIMGQAKPPETVDGALIQILADFQIERLKG
jgi:antitoxin CptB